MDPNPAAKNTPASPPPADSPESNLPPKFNFSPPQPPLPSTFPGQTFKSQMFNSASFPGIPNQSSASGLPQAPYSPPPPAAPVSPPSAFNQPLGAANPPYYAQSPSVPPQVTIQPPPQAPSPPPPPTGEPFIVSSDRTGKFPMMTVTMILILIITGFSGSFLYFRFIGNNSGRSTDGLPDSQIQVTQEQILITPPAAETGAASGDAATYVNPFDSDPAGENPFATESAYQNPFGEEESLSGYQNPFETTL